MWKYWGLDNKWNDSMNYDYFISVTPPETIRRARQAIQEHHEGLRGTNYRLRQKKATQPPVFLEEPVQEQMI